MNAFLPFLAFLIPLAIYLGVLGLINRRQRPLLVSGPWDFAGVLFAASGFLLVGGPSLLEWVNERWQLTHLRGTDGSSYYVWLGLWGLYFLAVVAGSGLLLWMRRNQLAIYNVEPAAFNDVLTHALDRLGLAWSRSGQQLYLGYATGPVVPRADFPASSSPAKAGATAGAAQLHTSLGSLPELTGYAARLELEPSPALRHVTLFFHEVEAPLRQEIEGELTQALTRIWTRPHPTGAWLFAASAFLFCLAVILMLGAILLSAITQI